MSALADTRPLAGIRVVEFGQFIAVPGAAMLLADMGADVIKVESPEGDSARRSASLGLQSPMYVGYNRNKRGIAIDLRSEDGRAVARELALGADVVLQNARAGTLERLGLGAAALRAVKPELIYASVSGFGLAGPSRARPGLDIAAQAESGMMSITGESGGGPLKVGFAVVDAATALALCSAITAALLRRFRTGVGETIETSLLQVAVQLQTQIWSEFQHTGKTPARVGNRQPMAAPAADLIPVSDGFLVISAYLETHFRRLCEAIGRPALADDPRFATNAARVANRASLLPEIAAGLSHLTGEAAREKLESHGVVVGIVRAYPQVLKSADVLAEGLFQPVDNGEGRAIALPGLPFQLADTPLPPATPVPRIGQHSVAILQEAGFTAERIQALLDAGAVLAETATCDAPPA